MDTQRPERPEQNLTGLAAAATSVDSLPSTGTDVPGLWIVATESGTRYVLVVPPEGRARAIRVASYGWDRNQWQGLRSAHAYRPEASSEEPREPVRVGEPALVDFGPSRHDWYRSTTVVSILAYPMPALLAVDQVEEFAHAAMLDSTLDLIAAAHRKGKLADEAALAETCTALHVNVEQALERIAAGERADG